MALRAVIAHLNGVEYEAAAKETEMTADHIEAVEKAAGI